MKRVTRRAALKRFSTTPLWASAGALAAAAARGTHVAVVGAGAFGGWTALHLLRMGAQVTLLDAWGPGNSRASSGGETRVIRSLYGPDRIYAQWVVRSLELWRENQQRWNTSLYHRAGLLWMCVKDDAYVRESLPIARNLGLQIDQLERSEAEKRFPQINFEGVRSIYFEHEAGYLKARHACQTVCEQFQQEGGKYLRAEAAPGAIRSETLERLALADGGHVAADQYVFACGPWLGRVFPEAIGSSIRATRQEVYYFGAPSGDAWFEPGKLPVWIDFDERLFYGFPSIDERGVKIADDTRGAAFDPSGGDRTPTEEGVEQARRFLARRFPRLRPAPLIEARVCQYENSPDGHLIVDRHPEAKNVWFAGGGSGHGFKLSPALGEHVARCVLGSAKPEPMFSIARLAKLQGQSTQFGDKE
jgi:glycine/D-amino acid oxidase-like deaminating enzyme